MKPKGQIILVTMLAVFFLAGTVYAGGHTNWYTKARDQFWMKISKKIHLVDKKDRKKNAPPWTIDMVELAKLVAEEMKKDPALMAQLKGEKGDPGEQGEQGTPGVNATVLGRYLSLTNWDPANPMNLKGAQLKKAFLMDNWMTYTDLSEANLSGATLENTDFSGAKLTAADLREAKVSGCSFAGADLTDANLEGVEMDGAYGWDTAVWSNTICPDGSNSDDNGLTCVGHKPLP